MGTTTSFTPKLDNLPILSFEGTSIFVFNDSMNFIPASFILFFQFIAKTQTFSFMILEKQLLFDYF